MRPVKDPAPSRIAYRIDRLMLTPGFRVFLRYGLPVLLVAAGIAFWFSDEGRRQDTGDRIAEVRRQIEERPEFMVRMMAVENASPRTADEVRAAVPLDFPISSFDLDLDAIRADVEKLDAVAAASVHIRAGGVLSVSVSERVPAVVWRSADGLVALDATGHPVATLEARAERPDLPLLVGRGAGAAVPEALSLMAAAEPVAERVRGLRRVGERRWDVVLDRNQSIMLPEAEPVTALRKVMALDAAQDLLARDIAVVDFRNPRRPVVRLTPAAVDAMTEIQWAETEDTHR